MEYFASYGDDAEEPSAGAAPAAAEESVAAVASAPSSAPVAAGKHTSYAASAGSVLLSVAPSLPVASDVGRNVLSSNSIKGREEEAAAATGVLGSTYFSTDPRTAAALPQLLPSIDCAPQVNVFGAAALATRHGAPGSATAAYVHPESRMLMTNPKAATLHAAIQGPLTPHQEQHGGWFGVYRHRLGGEVEREHVNVTAFEREYHSYQHYGRAADPSNCSVEDFQRSSCPASAGRGAATQGRRIERGDAHGETGEGSTEVSARMAVANDRTGFLDETKKENYKRKRLRNDDAASEDFQGPWAPFVSETPSSTAGEEEGGATAGEDGDETAAEKKNKGEEASSAADRKKASRNDSASSSASSSSLSSSSSAGGGGSTAEKKDSVFHGGGEVDYQGRSWMSVPAGWRSDFDGLVAGGGVGDSSSCFPPKREIHSFTGHTGGVQAIRFYPVSGHLLLSASMDTTVKIWETEGKRRLRRTYTAHGHAVRDIQWSRVTEGEKFYSCSYDSTVKLWDTEKGVVISSFTNGKTPYCVSVSPQDENIFIIGCSNRRAVQFDARTGQVEVEYSEHIGSVNTVTFCEEGKRLMTTGDDKKLFVWEFGIPVVIKHVSEPHMHSMPAAAKHPSERYVAYQSMDNQLLVYEAHGKFRPVPRKHFKGHVCAGYACHPCFSPDGRWILSGDGSGKLWVWDWKKGKITRSLQAHEQVCIDCQWHPARTSRVATCGWDGLIKLWD